MEGRAGAATPNDTRCPNSRMLFLYISVSNAVIVDDLTIVGDVLIMPTDLICAAFGDLLHDAETRCGRPVNYEKRQLNRLGGRNMKRDRAAATATRTATKTHGHPTLWQMLGRSR